MYGYAAGDPINNSDPFGLCPESMGGDGKTKLLSDCPEGSKGFKMYEELSASTHADASAVASEGDQLDRATRVACHQGTILRSASQGAAVGRLAGAIAGGAVNAVRVGRTWGVAGALIVGVPTGGAGAPAGFYIGATIGVAYGAVTGTSSGSQAGLVIGAAAGAAIGAATCGN